MSNKLSGFSFGWFDTTLLTPDPEGFCKKLKHVVGPIHAKPPVELVMPEGRPIRYNVIAGGVPVNKAKETAATKPTFFFIMEAVSRPTLIWAPERTELDPYVRGSMDTKEQWKPVRMALLELRAGMALHFDPSNVWHGITQFPAIGVDNGFSLIMVEVPGFEKTEIEDAANAAAAMLEADRPYWSNRKRAKNQ